MRASPQKYAPCRLKHIQGPQSEGVINQTTENISHQDQDAEKTNLSQHDQGPHDQGPFL